MPDERDAEAAEWPGAAFEARVDAAFDVMAEKGCDYSPYPLRVVAAEALRAADAVPDPRREAERRVVEAARAWHASMPAVLRLTADRLDGPMRPLLDALAALDGEAPNGG